jgi:alanine-glyoxylate transaminase / serine-glyoxylate transaminase / serine-pyruvate transaminase
MIKMTIGPSRIAQSVLKQMCVPAPAITDPEFLRIFGKCLSDLRTILGAEGGRSFIIPGTGTLGMEMIAANFVPPGGSVAIISTGFWGERWALICQRLGFDVHKVTCSPGAAPDEEQVKSLLRQKSCRALLLTHVDSSSGVLTDLPNLAAIAQQSGAFTLVDGICAAGIEAVEQANWSVDVYLTSTPKGLGVPAGLVLISTSARAKDWLIRRPWLCPSLALDLAPWVPVMEAAEEGAPGYFQSPAGNLVLGLSEGLRLVRAETLEARLNRHRALTRRLHAGLAANGIELLVEKTTDRANGVTVCFYPGSSGPDFLAEAQKFGVLLVSGLYPGLATRTFRIGHLGNVTETDIDITLKAIEQSSFLGSAPVSHAE